MGPLSIIIYGGDGSAGKWSRRNPRCSTLNLMRVPYIKIAGRENPVQVLGTYCWNLITITIQSSCQRQCHNSSNQIKQPLTYKYTCRVCTTVLFMRTVLSTRLSRTPSPRVHNLNLQTNPHNENKTAHFVFGRRQQNIYQVSTRSLLYGHSTDYEYFNPIRNGNRGET